jgi:hypothetical protein
MCSCAAEHLIFTTSTEERTVDLTNKGTTKDSQRFSRWFHSVWRMAWAPMTLLINSLTACQPNKIRKRKERGSKEKSI